MKRKKQTLWVEYALITALVLTGLIALRILTAPIIRYYMHPHSIVHEVIG